MAKLAQAGYVRMESSTWKASSVQQYGMYSGTVPVEDGLADGNHWLCLEPLG
jgi:hypothetical protein